MNVNLKGTLSSIVIYPIKSLPGIELQKADLSIGKGLQGDRRWAIPQNASVTKSGEWLPCENFDRLTINAGLSQFSPTRLRAAWHWQHPAGKAYALDEQFNQVCLNNDPSGGTLVSAQKGFWDHQDAHISIINLESVKALSDQLGFALDPRRFRANLYINAPAWSEFSWLGQAANLGSVELNFIRPIDRCKATSINPQTGHIDSNIPAELTRYYGHHFCGIYAQVQTSGTISPNANFQFSSQKSTRVPESAIGQKTAPTTTQWPRPARVKEVIAETPNINSVWLEPQVELDERTQHFAPGQHIIIHNLGVAHVYRAYTISATRNNQFRITVKRQNGAGSNAIHNLSKGDGVIISGPKGNLKIFDGAEHIVFATAGIGITPATALLPALKSGSKSVEFCHTASTYTDAALWSEIECFARTSSLANATLYLTQAKPHSENQCTSRPDFEALFASLDKQKTQIIICGPVGFVQSVQTAAQSAGISGAMICTETFATPNSDRTNMVPECEGPFTVKFKKSAQAAVWHKQDGTLLDLAEKAGMVLPAHCRAGICGTCETRVLSGAVQSTNNSGELVLCCSAFPKSDLELDA